MNASRFIAGRLRFKGMIAMVAIAISFFVIILAVAVSAGFRKELRGGIAKMSGDVSITTPDLNYANEDNPIEDFPTLQSAISGVKGVKSVIPVVYRAGIVKSGTEINGALFKGTPDGADSLQVSVPTALADKLGISVGDEITSYYIGSRVKARRFRVASLYDDVLGGTGTYIIKAGISDMQRLNSWSEDQVSSVEVILDDAWSGNFQMEMKADEIGTMVMAATPSDKSAPVALSALHRYPQIFAWLDLIDRNVLVILILMTIVAGFNMISGLLILLFRNVSTIGTLKSMGMTDRSIAELFLRVSSNLVLKGMAIGNGLALLFCLIQGTTHLIRLNPENYFVSFVPVSVAPGLIIAADIAAYLVIMILLLIPSLYVSRVDPAKTVRAK